MRGVRRGCDEGKVFKTLIAVNVPTEWKCKKKIKLVDLLPSQIDMPWVAFLKKQSRYCLFPKLKNSDGSVSDSYTVSDQAGTVWPLDATVKDVLGFQDLTQLHPRYSVNIVFGGGVAATTRKTRNSGNRHKETDKTTGGQRHQNQKKKKQRKSAPPPRPRSSDPAPAQPKSPRTRAQKSPGSKRNSNAAADSALEIYHPPVTRRSRSVTKTANDDGRSARVQESSGAGIMPKKILRSSATKRKRTSPPVTSDADTVQVQEKKPSRISTRAKAKPSPRQSSNTPAPVSQEPQQEQSRSRRALRDRSQTLGISPDITMLPLPPPQAKNSRPTRKLRSSFINGDQPKASPKSARQTRKRKASPSTSSTLPVKIPLIKSPPPPDNGEKLKPSLRIQMRYAEQNLGHGQIEERADVSVAGPSSSTPISNSLPLTLAITNETGNDRKQRNTKAGARAIVSTSYLESDSDTDSDSDMEISEFMESSLHLFYKNPPQMDSDLVVAQQNFGATSLSHLPPTVFPQFEGGELTIPSRGRPMMVRVAQRPIDYSNRPGITTVTLPHTVPPPCSSTSTSTPSTPTRNPTVTCPDARTMFYHNCNKFTSQPFFESIYSELRSVWESGRWVQATREIPFTASFFAIAFELQSKRKN